LAAADGDAAGLDKILSSEFSAERRDSDGVRSMLAYVAERRQRPENARPAKQ